MRRVVITGLGCVTPLGVGVDALWEGLLAGRSGIGPLTRFDPSPYKCRVAGEVRDFNPRDFMSPKDVRVSSRCVHLAVAAARMAVEDAGLNLARCDRERVGVFIGTSMGPSVYWAQHLAVFLEKGIRRVPPLFPAQAYPGVAASTVSILLGLTGPALTVSTACTSGADALWLGSQAVASGLVDYAIAGGADDPIFPLLFASFDRLGMMARSNGVPALACRPFSADRDGFVLSEGAAMCLLQAEEAAAWHSPRRAYAWLAGCGATSDAYDQFKPLPSGEHGARAVLQALAAAGVTVADLRYINAHAIGSPLGDAVEATILRRVLGEHAGEIPVSSAKGAFGHPMGASGAVEAVVCAKVVAEGVAPASINAVEPERMGLDLILGEPRPVPPGAVVSTTFGFGSRNAALVLRPLG